MEPNDFRESRQAINRMCEEIDTLIDQGSVEKTRACFDEVTDELEKLRPQAEGVIQKRSVKNLGMKLNILSTKIDKLKTGKTSSRKSSGSRQTIVWDQDRLAGLSTPFLKKLIANMAEDESSQVMLGTTGKGIRPNYRIQYNDGTVKGFTGSGHKPQDPLPASGTANISEPFSFQVIQSILDSK